VSLFQKQRVDVSFPSCFDSWAMIPRSSTRFCSQTSLSKRIAEKLEHNDTRVRGNLMRKLIRQGLRSNEIDVSGKLEFRDVRTINALLENFPQTKFFDFKFLNQISDDLTRSITSSDQALRFMKNISDLGCSNEKLIVPVVTQLLSKAPAERLSVDQVVMLMNILARQRLRLPDLSRSLVDEYYAQMTNGQRIRVLTNMASLSLPIDSLPNLPTVPSSPYACTDIISALIMSPGSMKAGSFTESHLLPSVLNLTKAFSPNVDLNEISHKMRSKLLLARAALVYAYPELHSQLPESSRAFLSYLAVSAAPTAKKDYDADRFVSTVSETLFKQNIRHHVGTSFGAFQVDIEEAGNRVIWNCDTQKRFYMGTDFKMKTSFYALRDEIIRNMGYTVIQIPYWHWERITERKARSDYCRMSRHLALSQSAPVSTTETTDSFRGEYFFKKSIPKRSWSWHGHATVPVRISI
jgi:hypothetical protein